MGAAPHCHVPALTSYWRLRLEEDCVQEWGMCQVCQERSCRKARALFCRKQPGSGKAAAEMESRIVPGFVVLFSWNPCRLHPSNCKSGCSWVGIPGVSGKHPLEARLKGHV
uniref:Uncharacterized protein n=1 Tax=Mus musculus TaxID=10090 RepID=Q3UUQ0_MOUSE|nr:unnamed protein product [Mus musculus]